MADPNRGSNFSDIDGGGKNRALGEAVTEAVLEPCDSVSVREELNEGVPFEGDPVGVKDALDGVRDPLVGVALEVSEVVND